MAKKIVIARVDIKKGKENDFLAIAQALIENTRNEDGNIFYTLYQNPFNASEFIFYEEYVDQAAVDSHMAAAHFRVFAENLGPLLEKDLDIQTF